MSIFQNTCKPKGLGGKIMLEGMNLGHKPLHEWGFSQLEIEDDSVCLDIGCGGGSNLKRLLTAAKRTTVYGIDYSPLSVKKSLKVCNEYVNRIRCFVEQMDVLKLDYKDEQFDLVTAFETIYFWKDLDLAFKNIYRVLKNGGKLFICNESNGKVESQEKWCKIIEGMKIYKNEEITEALKNAGFKDIKVNESKESWVSFSAIK